MGCKPGLVVQAILCYRHRMPSKTLLNQTYELVEESRGRLTQEEIAQGADVTLTWYQKFVRKTIPDPSVKRVQKIHDYLRRTLAA